MKHKFLLILAIAAFGALLYPPSPGLATPILGSAQSFAALGYAGVTNAHSDPNPQTTIWGNVGVDPGPLTAITGFPPAIVTGGTIYGPGGVSFNARQDVTTAYNLLAGMSPSTPLAAADLTLAGTLTPGVYTVPAGLTNLSGALNLDGLGNANAAWVFQMPSTLITSSGSVVNVINTGAGAGVYWQVGSSATLGDDTVFAGNILAYASVILDPRAEILCGRAFALTESVTLIDNLISNDNTAEDFGSGRSDFGSFGFSGGLDVIPETGEVVFLPNVPVGDNGGGTAPVPEPATILLLGSGLFGLVFRKKKIVK